MLTVLDPNHISQILSIVPLAARFTNIVTQSGETFSSKPSFWQNGYRSRGILGCSWYYYWWTWIFTISKFVPLYAVTSGSTMLKCQCRESTFICQCYKDKAKNRLNSSTIASLLKTKDGVKQQNSTGTGNYVTLFQQLKSGRKCSLAYFTLPIMRLSRIQFLIMINNIYLPWQIVKLAWTFCELAIVLWTFYEFLIINCYEHFVNKKIFLLWTMGDLKNV